MQIGNRHILVVGDRVLLRPDKSEGRTKVGLYLPQSVLAKEPVQVGRVMATGPGIAVPSMSQDFGEPWQEHPKKEPQYIPMQAEIGDLALFLKKEGVDILYNDEEFVVVPQSAILLLIRGEDEEELTDKA